MVKGGRLARQRKGASGSVSGFVFSLVQLSAADMEWNANAYIPDLFRAASGSGRKVGGKAALQESLVSADRS